MRVFCSTCRAFFEPDDKITSIPIFDGSSAIRMMIVEYHHAKCVSSEPNISYEQLVQLISPKKNLAVDRNTRYTYKKRLEKKAKECGEHTCANPGCDKMTANKFCSRVCANNANKTKLATRKFVEGHYFNLSK